MRSLLWLAAASMGAAHATAAPWSHSQTFNDPTVSPEDLFGSAVALDGNYVLIGAPDDDTNGTNVGQAYLFDATTGNLIHTFDDPTVTGEDKFGYSVALDGNNVLIGARYDSTQDTQVGQAHLFDATTGNLIRTFDDPSATIRDQFGVSVDLDGNNVLIGANRDSTYEFFGGQAYLFDATNGNLLHTFDDPTLDGQGDQFGYSVAIDGNNVLIGALDDGTQGSYVGQAHLFDATTGNLLHTFDDPSVSPDDQFGAAVALDGNYVLIGATDDNTNGSGAGQAYLFDATTGNLLHTFDDPTPATDNYFGWSVAVDGNNVLIGAIGDSTQGNFVGQAYLFDATTGNLLHTFIDPTVTTFDEFGASVALDGNNVLVGARYDSTQDSDVGQAYLFTLDSLSGAVPEPSTLVLAEFGMLPLVFRRRR